MQNVATEMEAGLKGTPQGAESFDRRRDVMNAAFAKRTGEKVEDEERGWRDRSGRFVITSNERIIRRITMKSSPIPVVPDPDARKRIGVISHAQQVASSVQAPRGRRTTSLFAEMAASVGEFVLDNTESWSLNEEPCPAMPYRTKVQAFEHNEVKLDFVVDTVAQLQERVAQLEERFKQVLAVEANSNAGGSGPSQTCSSPTVHHSASIEDCALPAESAALTKRFLDDKDSISMAESTWDACLFVGLPCIGHDVSLVIVLMYMLKLVLQLGFTVVVYNTLLVDP